MIDVTKLAWCSCSSVSIETHLADQVASAAEFALDLYGIGWPREIDEWAQVDIDTHAFRILAGKRSAVMIVRHDYDGAPDGSGYRIKSVEVIL